MPDQTVLDRRIVLKGAATLPVAGLPLAAVLADPALARAAAAGLETVTVKTAGGHDVSAALAMPAKTPAPAVLMVHEWWGLNDQIKAVAADFAAQGYVALAIDLFDGKVATTPDQAKAQISALDPARGTDIATSWVRYLRGHKAVDGKIGTIGWCFGGGWSLNTSIATPVEATVIYYGRVDKTAAELKTLKGPVLGHFGTLDRFINKPMVDGFQAAMAEAGKRLTVHWYEANHAFANPTGASYDAADAKLAWERTTKFFREQLG